MEKILEMLKCKDVELFQLGIIALMNSSYNERRDFISRYFERRGGGQYSTMILFESAWTQGAMTFVKSIGNKVWIRGNYCMYMRHDGYNVKLYIHNVRANMKNDPMVNKEKIYL
jgi:hypothetical protein